MSSSTIHCTIALDAPGKQFGVLQLPRSSNQSGWSTLWIPIVSVANGEGPTVLVLGGVHGDEPEGQVAALNLARELQPEQVSGRVIVIPCLSPEASRAYTRLWPSGANLNRSFPGSPGGPPDEQLAHHLSTELFPLADVVVDIHSGGRTGLCLPWSEMHWVDDPAQRRSMADAMLAWNTDWCCVYIDVAGTGLPSPKGGANFSPASCAPPGWAPVARALAGPSLEERTLAGRMSGALTSPVTWGAVSRGATTPSAGPRSWRMSPRPATPAISRPTMTRSSGGTAPAARSPHGRPSVMLASACLTVAAQTEKGDTQSSGGERSERQGRDTVSDGHVGLHHGPDGGAGVVPVTR